MPIDRAATLRNADKFLKQGKLDSAIAEYLRVVEDQPRDWNTANVLGDLYVRAGQPDKAIEQFARIADSLAGEGFLPKASALYKKILKLRPDHEHALVQAAEIAAGQGLLVDARAHLKAVAERRRGRGDDRGAAEIEVRLGALDPSDYGARIAAALARARIGEPDAAVGDLKAIALELNEAGRAGEAADALRAAGQIAPDDGDIQAGLLQAYVAAGNLAEAREWARRPADYQAIASALAERKHDADAVAVLRHALARYPGDGELRAALARALLAVGQVDAAAEFFDGEAADPALALKIAEAHLAAGRLDQGLGLLRTLLAADPLQRDAVAVVAWNLDARAPSVVFPVVDLVTAVASEQGDFDWAALALQEFVKRRPGDVPALMRLVEVCVDGDLERTTAIAQAQLADAYLDAGAAAEARIIAEDLAVRDPSNPTNVERLRRALAMVGEPDPEAAIAELLNPASALEALDFGPEPSSVKEAAEPKVESAAPRVEPPAAPVPPVAESPSPARATLPPAVPPPPAAPPRRPSPDRGPFDLSATAIDIEGLLRELEGPPPAKADPEHPEIDLSVALETMRRAAPPATSPAPRAAAPPPPTTPPSSSAAPPPASAAVPPPAPSPPQGDLDAVFGQLRQDAAARRTVDTSEQDYARGAALFEAGDVDAALDALASAARAPRSRFRAASLAARICRSRGRAAQAIEWMERAAEAPAPDREQAHALLYDLAELLEAEGEAARALAVCLELRAEAGDYRDVGVRVDRLSRVQTRG